MLTMTSRERGAANALDQTFDPEQSTGATFLFKGDQITIEGQAEGLEFLDHAVLMAPGSITHHSDMTARYVKLAGTQAGPQKLTVQIPSDGSVPRGFYMLFVLSSTGVPSVARWLKVQ